MDKEELVGHSEELHGGEALHFKTYSTYHSKHGPFVGTLFLTNFRIIFKRLQDPPPNVVHKFGEISIELGKIFKISKYPTKHSDSLLEIWCKDFNVARFSFAEGQACTKAHKNLHKFAFLPSTDRVFAFQYKMPIGPGEEEPWNRFDGWKIYDPVKEYARMGIPDAKWRISNINQFYKLCPSYPRLLVVPASIEDSQLKDAASFRMKERIPTLSWRHPTSGAALSRSSQPRVGWGRTRSSADEELIAGIRLANPKHNLPLVVADARPRIDVVANQAMGAGAEGHHYENTEINFLGIGNASRVSEAATKLLHLIHSEDSGGEWLVRLSQTRWLEYLSLLVASSVQIARSIEKGYSVHVHCSDGWDRTAQLVSLTMLLSDPYYRTIDGFCVLVEKEWLSFGHKFEDRMGHANIDHESKERSPIFVQWVDCVYQFITQFPTAFEFNEHFIITLLDAVYSLQYGTFLGDNERSRVTALLSDRTSSFWSEVHANKRSYTNAYYTSNSCPGLLQPCSEIRHLRFWAGYYLRHSISCSAQHVVLGEWDAKILQTAQDKQALQQSTRKLESVNEELKQQISSLVNEKVKASCEVTVLWQKIDSLLDLMHSTGDADLFAQAQALMEPANADASPCNIVPLEPDRFSSDSANTSAASDTNTADPSVTFYNLKASIRSGYNTDDEHSGYNTAIRTNSDIDSDQTVIRRRRENVNSTTIVNSIVHNILSSVDEYVNIEHTPPSSAPLETFSPLVRTSSKVRKGAKSVPNSSDDNGNDEGECRRHRHHHGTRRWRQMLDEKNNLLEENIKLKESNRDLERRLQLLEKTLESERDRAQRLAASKKSLISNLTHISESPPLNIRCVDNSSSSRFAEMHEIKDPVQILEDKYVLGGSDVRVFSNYTSSDRERCEIDHSYPITIPDRWCAGCDVVIKGHFVMVRVAGKMLPHCRSCADALVSLNQQAEQCSCHLPSPSHSSFFSLTPPSPPSSDHPCPNCSKVMRVKSL